MTSRLTVDIFTTDRPTDCSILEPPNSNEKKFMSLPVCTDVFKYSFFLGPLPIGIPFHWLFVSRSRLSPSTGLCSSRYPPTVADHHDTPAVTDGLHPLLDIQPKNRIDELSVTCEILGSVRHIMQCTLY